jgi:hypothetical protein
LGDLRADLLARSIAKLVRKLRPRPDDGVSAAAATVLVGARDGPAGPMSALVPARVLIAGDLPKVGSGQFHEASRPNGPARDPASAEADNRRHD